MCMNLKNKSIFLTGGAGFIGSHIAERLMDDNKITIYGTFHRDSLNYTNIPQHPNVEIIKGDVLDKEKLEKSMLGSDMVVHLAGITGAPTVVKMPNLTLRVNLMGTYNALEAAKKMDLESFIDFSTSEVYGADAYESGEKDDTSIGPIGEPRWVYALSKLSAEYLSHSWFKEYGIPVTSVRPFNIYGPRQMGIGAVMMFANNIINNRELVIHNDGIQVRSWCYIDDFVDCILLILGNKKAVGNIFNIGNAKATCTILGLAEAMIRLSGSKSKITFKKIDYPDVKTRVPNIDKAREMLGFEAKVSLEEGLKKTIEWYRQNMKE